MADKIDPDGTGSSESILRQRAEGKLSRSPVATRELKDKTPEEILHDLRVHQIELETQNQELRRVQLELEASRNKYQDLYDFAPVGYFTLTYKGLIREVNLTGATLVGMTRSKLIGRGFGHFVAPENLDQWEKHLLAVLGHEEKHSCVLTLKSEDGSSFYARLESIRTAAPVEPQEENNGGVVIRTAVSDITQSKLLENALLLSEERFRSLCESMSDGVAIYRAKKDGEDFVFLEFNEAAQKIEQISRSQIIGRSVLEVFPGVKEFGLFDVLQRVWRTGNAERYPIKEYKDNRIRGWKDNYVYKLPSGEIVAVYSDQTKRIIADEALRDSRERLDFALKGADLGSWDLDMPKGLAVVNEGAANIIGYRLDEIDPTLDFWQTLLHPDDIPHTLTVFEDHLAGHSDSYEAEYRVKTKSGEYKWVLARGKVMERDTGGRALRVTGTFQDITDRKKTEAVLRESEERHRIVAEFTHDWEYWVDAEGNFLYVSPSCERITGYTAEEFIDDPDLMNRIIHRDDRPVMLDHFYRVRKTAPHETDAMDFRIIRRDGATRWIGHVCQPVYGQEGQTLGRRGGNRDITEDKMVEELLRTTVKRYHTILSSLYAGVLVVSEEGRVEFANQALCDLFDVHDPPAKLLGLEPTEVIQRIRPVFNEPTQAINRIQAIVAHGLPVKGEEVAMSNGRTYLRDFVPILIDGERYGRLWLHNDITERKQSEDQIKLNESRLQSLYEISQHRAKNVQELLDFTLEHAIRLTGSQVGYIYYYDENNRRFILNTWSKEVMKQCEVAEPQNVYELERTGIWGEAVRQQTAIIVNDFQAPNPLKKGYPPGHVELFKYLTVPIFQGDKIVAVACVANKKSDYDDSDVRQLSLLMDSVWRMIENQRVLEQEKLLSTAVENTAEGIIITDAKGKIQYVNPAQEILSGYSRNELIGQTPNIFKSENYDENFYRTVWGTINSEKVWSGRFINKKKDGSEYHEDASISPVYDKSGNLTNLVAVKHDVTKQLELQDQLFQAQKMEAIGTLAGGFAHDFRNVLQVVMGFLDLIQMNNDLPEKLQTDLDKIRKATESGAELVKGMLVFSRKTSVKLEPLNLSKLVEHVESLLVRTIPKMIEIDLVNTHDLSMINGDTTQLEQILMNLAINAADAMPDGGRLTIKTNNIVLDDVFCRSYPKTKPGRYVVVTVSDTGTGMDEATVKRIFEPFFTTKEKGKGTGLGLTVVYGIVEQHGGIIKCDSEPSVGTTFNVYFPAIKEVREEQYSEKTEPPGGQGETILVVDDEPFFLETTSLFLMASNYKVITASNAKDALDLYKKHREEIKLVLLDLIMPEMGGKQCLEALLNIDPKIRVLVATGYTKRGMTPELKEAGARDFILKPFHMPQLLEKIRKTIDEH